MPNTDTNTNVLLFILFFLMIGCTAYYANYKGRNPVIWLLLAILLGVFAPLILLFLPDLKNKQKSNGLPTMTVSKPDLSLARPPGLPEELQKQEKEDKLWYYLDQNHHQTGPVSVVALRELWNRGKLELNQYVWSEGMEKWEKVDNLPELKAALTHTPNEIDN